MRASAIIPIHTRRFNAPEIFESLPFDEVIFIDTNEEKIWGRYQAMRRAKHPIIYTQDDDIINTEIKKLFDLTQEDPYTIHYAVPDEYPPKIAEKTFGKCQLALVGWGAMFHKDLLRVFDKYTDKYGVDDLLLREADRAFTVLQGRHHHHVVSKLKSLPGETDSLAMSSESTHKQTADEMVKRCLALCA